jgi:hypothetical protein
VPEILDSELTEGKFNNREYINNLKFRAASTPGQGRYIDKQQFRVSYKPVRKWEF